MSFVYDAVGNRTKRTDYIGRVTDYQYDNLNRLTNILYGGTVDSTYGYDDLSRLVSAVNASGTVSFTYDNRNRLKTETDVFGHVMEYGYDANGNRTLLKLDGANNATYAYDNADRVTGITNSSDSTTTNYGYDIANRLTSRVFPNSITTTYEYDNMSRLTRLKDATTSATLFDRQYAYNTANQISGITEPTRTRTFGYDNVDRLTAATDSVNGNESYGYDAVGNCTSSHRSSTYGYQPFNRLTATTTKNYSYDNAGNMTSAGNGDFTDFGYGWDFENRMTSSGTSSNGGLDSRSMQYRYDALGRRVSTTYTQSSYASGSSNITTNFTYDGQDAIMDVVTASTTPGEGAEEPGEPSPAETTVTKYLNGSGIDNKLRQTTGTDTKYFLADHLGSTNALTNSTGVVSSSASYDSFGNQTGNLATRYGFTGREQDGMTGLMYYRARFYDPNLGRFVSEDPIGFGGGDINLYGYVGNNSVNQRDPLGLYPDNFYEFYQNPYDVIPESGWIVIAHVGNYSAGFGDTITLGFTRWVRQNEGIDDVVDKCSWAYSAGGWTAVAGEVAAGGYGLYKGSASFALRQAAKGIEVADVRFTVGAYDEIRGTVAGMDAHHVGQQALMKRLVLGYDPATAPSILVPRVGHTIRGPNGIISRSTRGLNNTRDVIARDIWELRRVYPDVPNANLRQLIEMNKTMYPNAMAK